METALQAHGTGTTRVFVVTEVDQTHVVAYYAWCMASLGDATGDGWKPCEEIGQVNSIRINDQLCLCFLWSDAGPEAVEIVDDHG